MKSYPQIRGVIYPGFISLVCVYMCVDGSSRIKNPGLLSQHFRVLADLFLYSNKNFQASVDNFFYHDERTATNNMATSREIKQSQDYFFFTPKTWSLLVYNNNNKVVYASESRLEQKGVSPIMSKDWCTTCVPHILVSKAESHPLCNRLWWPC